LGVDGRRPSTTRQLVELLAPDVVVLGVGEDDEDDAVEGAEVDELDDEPFESEPLAARLSVR